MTGRFRLARGTNCCEYNQQHQRRVQARIKAARFPVLKTLEQFHWTWPKKINRLAVQNLFRLEFLAQRANVVFLGTVGVGKTHLATALGYAACQQGHSVLFAGAIEVINDLQGAQKNGGLKPALKKYLRPELLILDEVGYLPIDQKGADLLFHARVPEHPQTAMHFQTATFPALSRRC